MDYGLPIYGQCAKANIKMITPPYHTAVRRSLRAFPTSPTACVLSEAGLPNLQERIANTIIKLAPKLLQGNNSLLYNATKLQAGKKKTSRHPSAIARCISMAKDLGVPTAIRSVIMKQPPPWQPLNSLICLDLAKYRKSDTNPLVYQTIFKETKANLQSKGWKFLYTDASKDQNQIAYAVVDANASTICTGNLFNFCSTYTAESVAILQALEYTHKIKGKWVICTDSLSTVKALLNGRNKNRLLNTVRCKLVEGKGLTKIMWIPGHVDIKGNEAADQRAKLATIEPLCTTAWFFKDDIVRLAQATFTDKPEKLLNPQHHYSKFYTTNKKLFYTSNASCNDMKMLTRLRIGHTILTHSHILKGESQPPCPYCNSHQLSVIHLLDECQHLTNMRTNTFGNSTPSDLLKIVEDKNIETIIKFLKLTKLSKLI